MFTPYNLFIIVLAYLLLLFAVAYYAERRERFGRSIVNNPYVYSLSLAVYCTSWTFYGSVGKAATSGLSFLTTYLGPTLMAALWVIILKKVVRVARANRITTISDFIGMRYGKSLSLSALVTVIAVVGVTPYLGLQIKAIISTFSLLSGGRSGSSEAGLFITLMLGAFAIIFGARRLDSSERHGGLVFAVAFESLVKLCAFLLVGGFVTYGVFDGFGDIMGRIQASEFSPLLSTGTGSFEWFALLCLSMTAILFLPRQFQMAVVENYDEGHVQKAAWLFPLYLFLMNIFVLPIAFGGLLSGGAGADADYFVLTIPLGQGARELSLLAFLGGFSAATSMVIVEALALSTMVMNSLVMRTLISFNDAPRFPQVVLNIKRIVILGVVFLGYLFAESIGGYYSLVDMGLKSFEAVSLFAPAFLLGLFWKRGNKKAAMAGLLAGFSVWSYTLVLPTMIKAGVVRDVGLVGRMVHSEMLNPQSLFGVTGLGEWGHSLLWSMLVNLVIYLGVSVFTQQEEEEAMQALVFVESYKGTGEAAPEGLYTVKDIEEILSQYIGRGDAQAAIRAFLDRRQRRWDELSPRELFELRHEAEGVLAGAIGSAMAAVIFENRFVLTERDRGELSESVRHMTENLRLSRKELAEANRELLYLKEFSENIIESAPIGIATVDSLLKVRYWNRGMESVTGIGRSEAMDRSLILLLPWIPSGTLLQKGQKEGTFQTPAHQTLTVTISPFKDSSGYMAGGYVVILEDVTEKRKMAEELLQSSKMASIGRLTAGISHEVGNPLASISSLVQELASLEMETEEDREFTGSSLQEINSHIERIARIVRSLGDFARISSSEKVPASVADILDRAVSLVKYDRRFRDIRLVTEIGELPQVRVNPDQIQQVFLNLILNAMDAMPGGGEIRISAVRAGNSLEISFTDSGPGIDEAVQGRIFDPFFSTKPLGKGTGLGLSICYGIVRDHNGTISMQSRKGEGATFIIRLPVE
ncbi:MAG: ATP-binding protein [Thermodesulfovibrionales bacterium]|jgi:Na+/proline symporter/signal transduction histidine kinase